MLQARPQLRPPALGLLLGEAAELPHDPTLPPCNAPPLALVAFSSLATIGYEDALLARLQALLAAGADPNAGLQQCLTLGADANELSGAPGNRPLHHAVQRGRSLEHLQLLAQHEADITAHDSHGHNLAWFAARAGRQDVLAWLAPLGQHPPVHLHERFLAACAAADEAAARSLLAGHPGLIGELSALDQQLLPEQAQRGAIDSVRVMLSLGWPVAVPGPWQASALNQAAFRGDAAMVALLLQHGARWTERNGYGGTALGSCLHAGCHEPVPGGDYAAVLALLLADGAPAPADDGQLSDAMAAVVAEHGGPG